MIGSFAVRRGSLELDSSRVARGDNQWIFHYGLEFMDWLINRAEPLRLLDIKLACWYSALEPLDIVVIEL